MHFKLFLNAAFIWDSMTYMWEKCLWKAQKIPLSYLMTNSNKRKMQTRTKTNTIQRTDYAVKQK